jgi:hypothetical protein
MTDEAYIDDLFAREGIGWDKTPGFRAFVLHLMGIIGERPRAGDVSSMHLAYTAGLEHGKEWTDKRPTEAGEYWLAVHPDQRGLFLEEGVYKVEVRESNHVYYARGMTRFTDERLIGAKWSRRETPADPFEEPQP